VPPPFLRPSLQSLPLTGIARPSRGRFAPLRLSTDVLERTSRRLIAASSCRRPRFHAVAWPAPGDYELSFHAPKRASRLLWTPNCKPSRSVSFTRFEALILLRVRSRRTRLPRNDGRYSLELLPLWSLLLPRLGFSTRSRRRFPTAPLRPKAPLHRSETLTFHRRPRAPASSSGSRAPVLRPRAPAGLHEIRVPPCRPRASGRRSRPQTQTRHFRLVNPAPSRAREPAREPSPRAPALTRTREPRIELLPAECNLCTCPRARVPATPGGIVPAFGPEGPPAFPHPRLQRATQGTSRPQELGETIHKHKY